MDYEILKKEIAILKTSEKHYRILMDESMDPTFSFYRDGTYRYVNRAFAKGVGKPIDQIINHKIWDIFEKDEADKRFAVVKKVFAEGKTIEIEVRVPLPTGDTYYLTSVKPINDAAGNVETVICTSKNITKRKLAEIELQDKNEKLQDALDHIKKLSGLIPICAKCKKVRDDKGYYRRIETYLVEHADVQVSHTLCPDCLKELNPGLNIEDKVF